MDKRFIWTGVALGAAVAAALLFAELPEKTSVPLQETVSGVERSAGAQPREEDYAYLLKEKNGRIAVYARDKEEPEMVLDVLVKYLPDQDRQDLAEGIPVRDYSELVSLIEDYAS